MVKMLPVIGWTAWIFVSCLAIIFTMGLRRYARAEKPFSFLTATQTLYLWVAFLLFLPVPGLYKLHILWIVPLIFCGLFSYYMQGTLPVIILTWLFMKIVMIGVPTLLEKRQIMLSPPDNIFSTPFSVVLKTDLIMIISWLRRLKKAGGK